MTDDSETERQKIGQELQTLAAHLGLKSERAVANVTGVDRATIGKIYKGDESVRRGTIATVEAKLRSIDEEMGSERDEVSQLPRPTDRRVTVRATGNFGVEFMVEGHVDDLPELEEAILKLVKRMESGDSSGT